MTQYHVKRWMLKLVHTHLGLAELDYGTVIYSIIFPNGIYVVQDWRGLYRIVSIVIMYADCAEQLKFLFMSVSFCCSFLGLVL